ncbi:MAG: DUF5050 domain-containing protein [Clostridia bacterium]|nr:DUF5050 domain-containing protein [Clostridia bacterium]
MKRIISMILVLLLLGGCTKYNDDISSSVDEVGTTVTDTSDIIDNISSEEVSHNDVSTDETVTSSTNSEQASSIIDITSSSNDNSSKNDVSIVISSTDSSQGTKTQSFPIGEGNSFSNIVSSQGTIACSGDWIYYSNKSENGALYKMKSDCTENQRIGTDEKCVYINVVGEWIVYKCAANRSGLDTYIPQIVMCKTDGSDREILADNFSISFVYVRDKKLYFGSGDNETNRKLYVKDLETKTTLKYDDENYCPKSYDHAVPPYFLGDSIYFIDSYNLDYRYGNLCKKQINGTEKVKLTDNVVRQFDIYDGWIYYLDYNFNIRRVRIDGTGDCSVFSDDYISGFNVTKDAVFAAGGKIYKINHDGTDYQKYSPSVAFANTHFSVAGNYIYFIPNSSDGKYNKFKRLKIDAPSYSQGELLSFVVYW